MVRRIHVRQVKPGNLALDIGEAHHARDVLRLPADSVVEVFDDAGATAQGTLLFPTPTVTIVRVESITVSTPASLKWTIASAVPKGERADWLVEKLSELGTEAFIPLAAARSIVLPEGRNKANRWARISVEAAKQSRRAGVMRIGPLTTVADAVKAIAPPVSRGCYLSTEPGAQPIADVLRAFAGCSSITLFIGPEGGWTPQELALFERAGLTGARLTATVLRVETAAVAGAAVVACIDARQ